MPPKAWPAIGTIGTAIVVLTAQAVGQVAGWAVIENPGCLRDLGVSKRYGYPKMDGENNGKTY